MFELEMEKAIAAINDAQAKRVLIQLPDGLKPQAKDVVRQLEKTTSAEIFIWMSSCFGACDLPIGLRTVGIDFMVQWGHNQYHKTKEW